MTSGTAKVVFLDAAGTLRTELGLLEQVPALNLFAADGLKRASLRGTKELAGLDIYGLKGIPQARILVGAEGPHMEFADPTGNTFWYVPARAEGKP